MMTELVFALSILAALLVATFVVLIGRRPRQERGWSRGCEAITHKFSIDGHEGFITVDRHDDGSPAEIFINMAQEGSTIRGLMDSFAAMTSLALQHGVPLTLLVNRFTRTRFEPSGFTDNPKIPMVKSVLDYVFQWLAIQFLCRESQARAGIVWYKLFMHFHVITIFPEMFDSYLKESIIGRAIQAKKISIKFYNPWDFVPKKERVDGRPYGGGPGMVLRPEFFLGAVERALKRANPSQTLPLRKGRAKGGVKIILFSPSGKKFDTTYAKKSAKKYTDIILISGRYEGIDARVDKIFKTKKISIGDYVLTGGELPAMILIDCISRQVPGVLGKYESLEEERVSSSQVYTRPEILKWQGKSYRVPKVLLSGHHTKINEWKSRK